MAHHGNSDTTSNREKNDEKPLPTNFDEFLPWACIALEEDFFPIITRSTHRYDTESTITSMDGYLDYKSLVFIETIYDTVESLIQVKFHKQKIPRNLLKLIALIVSFHPQLTSIYINEGLDKAGLYELAHLLESSFITEVILDGTYIREGNYYLLLENESCLKYLSLARCSINDLVVNELTARLLFPLPMSKILSVLNLSSNRITDRGAQCLAEMLKTNRQLAYLNLADNMITDTGAEMILNNLKEFPLSIDEIIPTKTRKYDYLKQKNDLITKTVSEMANSHINKNDTKSKSDKSHANSLTRRTKNSRHRDSISKNTRETTYAESATSAIDARLGPFRDPYSSNNLIHKDGTTYCLGNNSLRCLSLAYNNLTNITVKKLYNVLKRQDHLHHHLNRCPRGLLQVCIDGNDICESCSDLANVMSIMERSSVIANVPVITTKKKGGTK